MKRLTRSNDKLVAGVISGISNYVNPELDPVFYDWHLPGLPFSIHA